jgi:HPt (histidine-containing phosphotransfer) domain-containing protein
MGEAMDIDKLQNAGIDWEDGVRRCGGDPALYERLLGMFANDTNFNEAAKSLEASDYEGLFSHTHEIKGMSGNLSITDVYADSSEVVALLRAKEYDSINAAFEKLRASYSQALEAIGE